MTRFAAVTGMLVGAACGGQVVRATTDAGDDGSNVVVVDASLSAESGAPCSALTIETSDAGAISGGCFFQATWTCGDQSYAASGTCTAVNCRGPSNFTVLPGPSGPQGCSCARPATFAAVAQAACQR